ncbi:MAG: hypothetical protein ABI351_13915 [Herbaspirillum sp.]
MPFFLESGGASTSTITANQGDPNTIAKAWPVKITDGTTVVGIDVTTTGMLVDVVASVLPSGASSAANQATMITDLASIDGHVAGVSTAANQATMIADLASIDGHVTGVSTAANQATEIVSLGHIDTATASLNTKLPAQGQSVMASSMPVTMASDQSALAVTQAANVAGKSVSQALTTTAVTVTKPASVIGFIVQNDATSLDFIRVAIGVTATASVGIVLQPGQDTGFIPAALNLSIIANSGTPIANIMWV